MEYEQIENKRKEEREKIQLAVRERLSVLGEALKQCAQNGNYEYLPALSDAIIRLEDHLLQSFG